MHHHPIHLKRKLHLSRPFWMVKWLSMIEPTVPHSRRMDMQLQVWVKTCEKPCNPLVNICQRQADKSGYINECSSLKLYGSIWYHSCHSFWSIPLALETLLRHNFCPGATNALMINCAASSPMASTQKSKFNRFFFELSPLVGCYSITSGFETIAEDEPQRAYIVMTDHW